ncbi:MAG: DHHA1 domain-containing protein [Candidatus Hodarchaeota archaeon]
MTTKLFHEDPYLQAFSSTITEHMQVSGKPAVILDQTAFYPTSGGQPHDTGRLNDVAVVDVIEEESHRIVHLLEEPIDVRNVAGQINWQRRFDHMQQHTGQHILSQAFISTCDAETISFHLGEESSTIDVDKSSLNFDRVTAVEKLANRIIFENRQVRTHFIRPDELHRFTVRKLPSVEENIRIIEVKDFDYSPCGGTHCSYTGEIGILKIRRFENYKGGSRIHFVCGWRALRDYQHKTEILKQLSEIMSSSVSDLPKNLRKIQDDTKYLHLENNNLKKQLLQYEAQALVSEIEKRGHINILKKIFKDRYPKDLKLLASKVLKSKANTVILFGVEEEKKASLLFLCSEALTFDMGDLMKRFAP